MSQAKEDALELIRRLPDDVTTADILDELYFKEQVDRGLRDAAEGRTITHEELKDRVARWRRSAGR
jgi:predicted transcriptional regulator